MIRLQSFSRHVLYTRYMVSHHMVSVLCVGVRPRAETRRIGRRHETRRNGLHQHYSSSWCTGEMKGDQEGLPYRLWEGHVSGVQVRGWADGSVSIPHYSIHRQAGRQQAQACRGHLTINSGTSSVATLLSSRRPPNPKLHVPLYLVLQRVLHRRRQLSEQLLTVHHQVDHLGRPLELEHAKRRQTPPQLLQPLLRELPAFFAFPLRSP